MKSYAPMKLVLAALSVCMMLVASIIWAQDQPPSPSAAQTGAQNGGKPDAPPETPVRPNTDSYAVSLGTGQLINLTGDQQGTGNAGSAEPPASLAEYADGLVVKTAGQDLRNQFFYGSSVSGFYTNGFSGTRYNKVYSSSIDPYLGVLIPTKTGSFMLQYAGVIDPNTQNANGLQAYHAMTFTAQGALTRRWYWAFNSGGSYGSELARAQGSLGYSVVESTPVVNTSAAATIVPANNASFGQARGTLTWLESRRNSISFTGFYTYSGIQGLHNTFGDIGNHENLVGTAVGFTHTVNERVAVRAYADANSVLNGPTCNSYGGGVGVTVRMSHSVVFDGQAGPQRNSAACGGQQNVGFSGSLVKSLRNGDRIYAAGGRFFTSAYRTNGFWENNAAVGFAKGLGRLTLISEAGYLRGAALASTIASFEGYFVAPRLRIKINNNMGFSGGYRLFNETGGGLQSGNLRFALVSIDWYPAPIHFR
jgi:hypothetical protein